MKAKIVVNRHIADANRRHGRDDPCISVKTYKQTIYCKKVESTGTIKLIQDIQHPLACGATIWMEANFESLILDGKPAREFLSEKPQKAIAETTEQSTQHELFKL